MNWAFEGQLGFRLIGPLNVVEPEPNGSLVPFTGFASCPMSWAMPLNLSKLINGPSRLLPGVLLALGFIGVLHPSQLNSVNGHYRANRVHLNQIQQGNDRPWYSPPRSPAFNDLTGS